MTTDVSKSLGYATLRPRPEAASSKALAYIAVAPPPLGAVSKVAAYIVLMEGEPPAPDVEVKVSKALLYVIMEPGSNGPLVYATSAAADILHRGGLPSARVTATVAEVLARRNGAALVTGSVAEVLTRRLPAAFVSGAVLEVLRSTAEVTVSAFVSTTVLDVLNTPSNTPIHVSSTILEVLMPASADTDVGSVWASG